MKPYITPEVKIDPDGKVWVCVGYNIPAQKFSIIPSESLNELRMTIATNERLRMAWLLDHLNEFQSFIQWRGNPETNGKFLDVNLPLWPKES